MGVHTFTPAGVDDEDAPFHFGKFGIGEDTPCPGRKGAMDRDCVAQAEEFVKSGVLRTEFLCCRVSVSAADRDDAFQQTKTYPRAEGVADCGK